MSRRVFMPNTTKKSCYYFFIPQPEKFSHKATSANFLRVVPLRRRQLVSEFHFTAQFIQTLSEGHILFLAVLFSEFSFNFSMS